MSTSHERFLELAVAEATASVRGGGGPFGAVVVRDGELLATGQNRVTASCDPTAHAEVLAIRAACARLRSHSLGGATLYASTEPCPLCLAASFWARLDRVFYAATRDDAARAGFDDAAFYDELARPARDRRIPCVCLPISSALQPLAAWSAAPNKVPY